MSNNIISVCSINPLGGTFVDWSIHFLAGKKTFYSVSDCNWVPVVSDPITKLNAHGHKKNHPSGFEETKKVLKLLESVTDQGFYTLYPFPLHADWSAKLLDIPTNEFPDYETHNKIQQKRLDDYSELINYCMDKNIKVVYLNLNKQNILYSKNIRTIDRLIFENKKAKNLEEAKKYNDYFFFNDSIDTWQKNNDIEIWDHRERLALCTRPFDCNYINNFKFNYTKPHLFIDARSLWYNGQATMKKIMTFCQLPIDDTRWKHWNLIYCKWQKQQLEILEFEFNYQHIVDSIVNNWYYELDYLSFEEEVIIQHCLIYQYGMNLKTWNLSKFPSNTQDLHKLLEPNIHPVASIYRDL